MERPMYRPPVKTLLEAMELHTEDTEVDISALYKQVEIDRAKLNSNIRRELQESSQISLAEVINRHPLRHGLTELVAYLHLVGDWKTVAVDEEVKEEVQWTANTNGNETLRKASLPRILLLRD